LAYVWLVLIWVTWCVLHSGMISHAVTGRLRQNLGDHYRYYRLTFNVFSLVTFTLAMEGAWYVVQLGLLFVAFWLFLAGGRHYDLLHTLGVRQMLGGSTHGAITKSGGLNTSGLLGVTRHPWYLATILFIWSYQRDLTVVGLIVKGILTVYLVVGTILEERKLVADFGDEYRQYQREVSMLLPWKFGGSLLRGRSGKVR
jgi:protein-S-isoprenylcysteine O-methyltransferase Ste14